MEIIGVIVAGIVIGLLGKLIAPGVAYQDTIRTIHSPRFMRDERAVEGSIEENPLHRELVEIAGMAGHDFVLDVVLAEERKIAEEEVEYLMSRGLSRDAATAKIVRGFLHVDIEGLPPELSEELRRAVKISEKELF